MFDFFWLKICYFKAMQKPCGEIPVNYFPNIPCVNVLDPMRLYNSVYVPIIGVALPCIAVHLYLQFYVISYKMYSALSTELLVR